jgi:hypothetical protein
MCRFAIYLGPSLTLDSLLTQPVHSIVHQSFHSHERREPLNGDGFGVAWYDELWSCGEADPLEATLRSIEAAFRRVLEAVSPDGTAEMRALNVTTAQSVPLVA